jgi:hypothetical protein
MRVRLVDLPDRLQRAAVLGWKPLHVELHVAGSFRDFDNLRESLAG